MAKKKMTMTKMTTRTMMRMTMKTNSPSCCGVVAVAAAVFSGSLRWKARKPSASCRPFWRTFWACCLWRCCCFCWCCRSCCSVLEFWACDRPSRLHHLCRRRPCRLACAFYSCFRDGRRRFRTRSDRCDPH